MPVCFFRQALCQGIARSSSKFVEPQIVQHLDYMKQRTGRHRLVWPGLSSALGGCADELSLELAAARAAGMKNGPPDRLSAAHP